MRVRSALLAAVFAASLIPAAPAAAPAEPSAPYVSAASSMSSVAASETTAPLPAKISISTPKIAVKQKASFGLAGKVSGVKLDEDESVDVYFWRLQGGTWKSRGHRSTKLTRLTTTTTKWNVSFKPSERGQFRAQARLKSADGRVKAVVTKKVRYRVVSRNYVALTFDDGSWRYTDSIRTSLDAHGVKATFFMLGDATNVYTKQAKRVADSGHQVAVHTMSHPMLPKLSDSAIKSQLTRCRAVIKRVTGKTATWYRPPGGATNSRVRRIAKGVGLREMLWTVDTNDWKRPSSSTIKARALKAKTGGVVLMHDGGGNRSNTAAAVPGIIDGYTSRGWDLVTLNEWAALQ